MSATPVTANIMGNIHIAMNADTREQAIAHLEDAQREIESLEEDRDLWRAEAERWRSVREGGAQ